MEFACTRTMKFACENVILFSDGKLFAFNLRISKHIYELSLQSASGVCFPVNAGKRSGFHECSEFANVC